MLGVRVPSGVPRRSKVRFAPASFYACGKKDVIRSLPCSSFPTATRCAGLAVGGPPCGRHFSRLRNIDFNRPFQKAETVWISTAESLVLQAVSAFSMPKIGPSQEWIFWRDSERLTGFELQVEGLLAAVSSRRPFSAGKRALRQKNLSHENRVLVLWTMHKSKSQRPLSFRKELEERT